jgi:hypothetical protein
VAVVSRQRLFDYALGLLIAGFGIALAHYTFHLHD